jgi:hypothetical protein
MLKTNEMMLNELNFILQRHKQKLRILNYLSDEIQLSNGTVLCGLNKKKCVKRLKVELHSLWRDNFDIVYGSDKELSEGKIKEIKRYGSAKGGISVQEKYGDVIKKNNLTAAGWSKGIDHNSYVKKDGTKWKPNPNKGLTKDTSETIRVKYSEGRMGYKNPMFGVEHTEEYKKEQSDRMKTKILSGEFTPNTNNRLTHYEVVFNNKKWRSSWEAVFHYLYPEYEYEKLRIPYEFNGEKYIYIVDFVDHNNKIAVEVKPIELFKDAKTSAKFAALELWCKENGYIAKKFTQNEIYFCKDKIEVSLFDENTQKKILGLLKIYEANQKN